MRAQKLVFRPDLEFSIVFGVLQFGEDLSGMPAWIEMVGVFSYFFLAPLLAAVSARQVFVIVEVVVLVLVEVGF